MFQSDSDQKPTFFGVGMYLLQSMSGLSLHLCTLPQNSKYSTHLRYWCLCSKHVEFFVTMTVRVRNKKVFCAYEKNPDTCLDFFNT